MPDKIVEITTPVWNENRQQEGMKHIEIERFKTNNLHIRLQIIVRTAIDIIVRIRASWTITAIS
jgi:hypothetical protein